MSSLFGSLFGISSGKGDAMNESAINAAASDYEKKAAALSMSTYKESVQVPPSLQKAAAAASAQRQAMQAAYGMGVGSVYMDANGMLQSGLAAAGAGHLYRSAHPSDIYSRFDEIDTPSYTRDNIKNTTCIDYDRDAIVKNEIGTLDLLEVFGGRYSEQKGAQQIHLGGIPSICIVSYDVPSKIKFSGAVAVSGAIDQHITGIRFCTKIKGRLSAINHELFMMSKYVEWTVCRVDDDMLEISSSISNMSSLTAAICQVNIKDTHT